MPPLLQNKVTELQEKILKLAYERLLEKEDLSFGEIFIALFGCRPEKIGPQKVQKLSLQEALIACRSAPGECFYFLDKTEADKYHVAQASVSQSVADLVKKGLLITLKEEKLIWAKDQPRVRRIKYYDMIRLTEAGEKIVVDKRRHPRHSLSLPIEYYLADMKTAYPGFTLNLSEEGLSIDLFKKLEVGQNLKLILLHAAYGSIEIFTKVVWINPPSRKGEMHRSGMRIVKLSPENKNRLVNLLANA